MNLMGIVRALGISRGMVHDSTRYLTYCGTVGGVGTAANPNGLSQLICHAHVKMDLVDFVLACETVEAAAGTVDVENRASGDAVAGGDDMITTVVPTAAGMAAANVPYTCTINTDGTQKVLKGSNVIITVGATGELAGLTYMAKFKRMN